MSAFNLDRFRFDRDTRTPVKQEQSQDPKSPESEKENKPAKMKPANTPTKPSEQGVVFIESESDDDDLVFVSEVASPNSKISLAKKSMDSSKHSVKECKGTKSGSQEEKINKLLAMFPQLTRSQVQEVTETSSTLDGAVAACLLRFGDKDPGKKRKMDGSSSSQDSGDGQPSKRRKPSVVYIEDEDVKEPDWDKQEAMVKRMQKKFPDQDKEELRSVLQEHDWKFTEALQSLQMFSDADTSLSSHESGEKDSKAQSKEKSSRPTNAERKNKSVHKDVSDSEDTEDEVSFVEEINSNKVESKPTIKHKEINCNKVESKPTIKHERKGRNYKQKKEVAKAEEVVSDATKDSEDSDSEPEEKLKLQNGHLSVGLRGISQSTPVKCSTAQSLSRFTSGTSMAKKAAVERKSRARAKEQHVSSEDEGGSGEDEEAVSSDFDDSDEELDLNSGKSEVKKEILKFFNDSTIDELTLISGCSVKKAQKIVELRPFRSWDNLLELIHKDNGLSVDLILGCKIVLKERKVVLGLMSKCETISSKLIRQVTEVMKSGSGSTKQPELLNSEFQMKSYQIIGLKWLMLLHEHELSCILADEMGLGKTIQAIAFLAQLYENGITGPHLITVPASTLDNWVRELKTWCPTLNVIIYYGSAEDRRYLKHDILSGEVEFDVIVTTYNLVIGNDSDRLFFRKLHLIYALFDEGHMLKNMNSLRYRHLMAINAKHRVLLTGTPLQNNLLELMSLLNFIMPSMFSDSTLQISKMFSMKSHDDQSKFERQRISQAKRIMKPFILRRLKSEVLKQLPAKEETIEYCSMSDKQTELYKSLFKKLKETTTGEKRELCNVMMQLRKMANHPLLHRQYYTTEKLKAMSKLMLKEPTHFDADAALIQEDMEVMSDFELHNLCKQYNTISSYQLETSILIDSGKFKHLTELLSSLKEKGDRVVLFSQFTMMLDIVEVFLKHLNHGYVRLDGSTPIADRIVLIDKFNTDRDIFVFLLSTRAGGLGINLTSANVVILHDIDCNPYNDKQAEDRCHRVGQTKTVQVIKLISKDTIEASILQLGQKKLKLEQDMTAAEESEEGTMPEDMATLLKATLGL